jgi:GH24 family phage-related lysozyme (muramidase)
MTYRGTTTLRSVLGLALVGLCTLCFSTRSLAAAGCFKRAADGAITAWVASCDATRVDEDGMKQIEREECPGGRLSGTCARPYNDSRKYCTIGVGHLLHKSACTKADRKAWSKVTSGQLEALFRSDLGSFERQINALKRKLRIKLNQCQYDALADLLFNGGPSWFISPKSRIYKALKNGNFSAIPGLIEQAVPAKADAKTKRALRQRRAREAAEFQKQDCCVPKHWIGTLTETYAPAQASSSQDDIQWSLTGHLTYTLDSASATLWHYAVGGSVDVHVSGHNYEGCPVSGVTPSTVSAGSPTEPRSYLDIDQQNPADPRYSIADTTGATVTITFGGDCAGSTEGFLVPPLRSDIGDQGADRSIYAGGAATLAGSWRSPSSDYYAIASNWSFTAAP